MNNEKLVYDLISWLTETELFNNDGSRIAYSTNNGYSFKSKDYKFVYNEITGYSVSLFVSLFNETGNEKFLHLAQKAANYLMSIQEKSDEPEISGSICHSFRHPSLEKMNLYYTFDNMIIIQGLCDLYSIDKNPRYLESAELIAGWIIKNMYKEKGSYYARYDMSGKNKQWITGKFPGDDGIIHSKGAIAFLKLYDITKNEKYRQIIEKNMEWVLDLQAEDGSFWVNAEKEYVFSHAQCYVCEGLVYSYFYLQDEKYLQALEKALEFFRKKLNNDGSLYHIYKDQVTWRKLLFGMFPYKTTDATSQYVRLVLLLAYIKKDGSLLNTYRLRDSLEFIANNQILNSSDNNRLYGLNHKVCNRYGYKIISPIMSAWCAQFTIQALLEYDAFDLNDESRYDDFISGLY